MKTINLKTEAALLSAALMLTVTACSTTSTAVNSGEESSSSDISSEEQLSQETETDPQPVSDDTKQNAYRAYLSTLESLKDPITSYTWMNTGSTDSNWLYPYDNTPCAVADVTGDGLEELIIMKDQGDVSAELDVYTYNASSDSAEVILTVDYLNSQLGSGRGVVVSVNVDGDLVIIDLPRFEGEYTTYIVYTFNGSEMICKESAVDMVTSNDDYTEFFHRYKINDNDVSESEYEAKTIEIADSMDTLLQYAMVLGDNAISKVLVMSSKAMTYDEMHDHLSVV